VRSVNPAPVACYLHIRDMIAVTHVNEMETYNDFDQVALLRWLICRSITLSLSLFVFHNDKAMSSY
jgi:hypothetical protein